MGLRDKFKSAGKSIREIDSERLIDRFDLQRSRYEGPTGIVGVLQDACGKFGIPAASLWAAVPHYVGQPPCPKATLALVRRIDTLLNRQGYTIRGVQQLLADADRAPPPAPADEQADLTAMLLAIRNRIADALRQDESLTPR